MTTANTASGSAAHGWRFFRAGGFDQVRLDAGGDLVNLDQLDQKLWVALACPAKGIEFDQKTLDLIDTDKDGRIRPPEILAAVKWACSLVRDPGVMVVGSPNLLLSAINDSNPEGKAVLASARQILTNLGRAGAGSISIEDVADTAKIFAATKFNGDGIVPADSADDAGVKSVMTDVIDCLGGETDRSGKPGITQAKLDAFYAEVKAYADWWEKGEKDAATVLPLGDKTATAAAAVRAIKAKVDDFFARCRLAAFDARALSAVNRQESEYLAIAAKDMTITSAEVAGFPLALVQANAALPLNSGVNPAWAGAIAALRDAAVKPLLGDKTTLTEADWATVNAKLAAHEAWVAGKAGAVVEKLGVPRIREILAGKGHEIVSSLIAKDKALEPEANVIATVDKLVRFNRDLCKLLNNFVNFRDFYGRIDKAVFQVGTLYLDQRSCDLCVRVEDLGKHGIMAPMSQAYLAYCECVRKATGEKMSIAAAFTAGDSDNLMVGRNGVFYDRLGRDWDATIVKIVDNPISIRQAFWAPYKRLIRWIQESMAKRAAAADAAASAKLEGVVTDTATAAQAAKPAAPPEPKKLDTGAIAALGIAFGFIATAFASLLTWITDAPTYMIPVYLGVILLLISGPSMFIAWLKLRQRNLGPILDANGWAVNARAKINIPFGRSLTGTAKLPAGSSRDMFDPYAESKRGRYITIAVAVVLIVLSLLWYFGVFGDVLPKSGYMLRKDAKAAEAQQAEIAKQSAAAQQATADAAKAQTEAAAKAQAEAIKAQAEAAAKAAKPADKP